MNERLIKLIKQDASKFYNSTAWKRMREQILIRDNHECQHCKKEGKVSTNNLQVHHTKEIKEYPELAMKPDNLTTLCGACHSDIHGKTDSFHEYNRKKLEEKKERLGIPERW